MQKQSTEASRRKTLGPTDFCASPLKPAHPLRIMVKQPLPDIGNTTPGLWNPATPLVFGDGSASPYRSSTQSDISTHTGSTDHSNSPTVSSPAAPTIDSAFYGFPVASQRSTVRKKRSGRSRRALPLEGSHLRRTANSTTIDLTGDALIPHRPQLTSDVATVDLTGDDAPVPGIQGPTSNLVDGKGREGSLPSAVARPERSVGENQLRFRPKLTAKSRRPRTSSNRAAPPALVRSDSSLLSEPPSVVSKAVHTNIGTPVRLPWSLRCL